MRNQNVHLLPLKILVMAHTANEQTTLVQNIQEFGLQPDIAINLPDILTKLKHSEKYDMLFISLNRGAGNTELTTFIRSGLGGKCPYLIGLASQLSEIEKNIYLRIGGLHDYLSSPQDKLKIKRLLEKVYRKKYGKNHTKIPLESVRSKKVWTINEEKEFQLHYVA